MQYENGRFLLKKKEMKKSQKMKTKRDEKRAILKIFKGQFRSSSSNLR
jgi:hypothetical protein